MSTHEPEQLKVTKLSSTTVKLPTTWTPPQAKVREPTKAHDTLQLAAQVYPWTYMSSTLDACFKSAEATAHKDLESRTKELESEESAISEERERLDAQRAIEFYDELGSDLFQKEAPTIMQRFYSHGDSCTKIETEALNLAVSSSPPNLEEEEPLKLYNQMLDDLENLQSEATGLQDSISRLIESASDKALGDEDDDSNESNDAEPTARQQVVNVFAACLPVLTARMANISMAQELVDIALENASLSVRMESLGLN